MPETITKTERQALTQTIPFDFDTGNSAAEVIIPTIAPLLLNLVSASDASILLHIITTGTAAWFDAVAPYTPTTVGFYSNIPRRPASESVTNRNMNIAILYANYRALLPFMPKNTADLRASMSGLGLDPDDDSTDLSTAVGIGNVAGNSVAAARAHDGMNALGDAGGKKYNRRPYEDTTRYEPVNTATDLLDPSRWQPDIKHANGIFKIQKFVTPQYRNTDPFIVTDVVDELHFPKPVELDWKKNKHLYKAQVDQVLARSAALTDQTKMEAELFNMKILSLGGVAGFAAASHGLGLVEFVQYDHAVLGAAFDAGIAVWKAKEKYDAVRPFSAVKFLYKNKKLTAWGGPGKGTVDDITGSEWRPYLETADHPEYPSASTCFCASHAAASRAYFGSDALNWTVTFPQGSSEIEPGITPATTITSTFPTWTEFANRCGQARANAGVHFDVSYQAALENCSIVGEKSFEVVQRHINGHAH